MANILVDLSKTNGHIKPMNAVNNGPVGSGVRKTGNFEDYKALEIPYARNHDASFCSSYGGEFTVDVHNIFRNFDADENDPASYIFEPTDEYIKSTLEAGTEIFYRLGSKIEHGFKYGTYPPKDFAKWARICEHIIRHYNEGWANGFNYNIEYWEIWNEPDCKNSDGSNPCWQGTDDQFLDFYEIAAKHLKSCFPGLKIGGPAFMSPWRNDFRKNFLKAVVERKIPMDFYSYHCYAKEPREVYGTVLEAEESLKEVGLEGMYTILNEWNYVRGWMAEDWKYSLESEMGLKGSSYVAGTMSICQNSSLGMLMYYDARPCGMNGIFKSYTYDRFKSYYTFIMFMDLRRLGTWVETRRLADEAFYSCAATDGKNAGVMVTYFVDDETAPAKEVTLDFENVKGENGVKVEYFLLDETHDLEKVREETFTAESFSVYLDMPVYSSYYVKVTAL